MVDISLKLIQLVATSLALCLLLAGCRTAATPTPLPLPTPGPTPVSIWKPGGARASVAPPPKLVNPRMLTVATDASNPPQEYVDTGGKVVGLDIDVAEELASRLGLELKIVNFKADDILLALAGGQFDAAISSLDITPQREELAAFAPYLRSGQALLTRKGEPAGIATLDDLSGKSVAAQQGSSEHQTLNSLNDKLAGAGRPPATLMLYPLDAQAVDQLRARRADSSLLEWPAANYYVTLYPGALEIAVAGFYSTHQGVAVAKSNKPMLEAIDTALKAMVQDGTLGVIKRKWGVERET